MTAAYRNTAVASKNSKSIELSGSKIYILIPNFKQHYINVGLRFLGEIKIHLCRATLQMASERGSLCDIVYT